ncbi:Protein bicaudal C 1-B [Liparis tanakae]|uniref:Protein bicaudal C 1-B n=1 Tax=Liparis tanakae TaxID=230148 RepID=A0A4Z2HYX4_9TELE|nr:Protein bicaudal C 1-B [Liparis tanakae]
MCDAVSSLSRVGLMGRRGSLQGPEMAKLFNHGRRHSTGQALTYRLLNPEMEGGRSERRNSLRRDVTMAQDVRSDSSKAEDYDYERKKLLATRAMQRKPVLTEVQTPTDTWSGLGFSKSMPAEAIKELRNISRRSYKPYLSISNSQQQSWAAQMGKMFNGSNCDNWRDRCGATSASLPVPSSSSSSSSSSSPSSTPTAFTSSTSSFASFASSMNRSRNDKPSESFPGSGSYFEDLNKSKRRLSDTPAVKPGYLEGGASGRLPPIVDLEVAAQSNRW